MEPQMEIYYQTGDTFQVDTYPASYSWEAFPASRYGGYVIKDSKGVLVAWYSDQYLICIKAAS